MVIETFKSEETDNSSWVKDFDSVRWKLVTNEVKGEVNVLEEE